MTSQTTDTQPQGGGRTGTAHVKRGMARCSRAA